MRRGSSITSTRELNLRAADNNESPSVASCEPEVRSCKQSNKEGKEGFDSLNTRIFWHQKLNTTNECAALRTKSKVNGEKRECGFFSSSKGEALIV